MMPDLVTLVPTAVIVAGGSASGLRFLQVRVEFRLNELACDPNDATGRQPARAAFQRWQSTGEGMCKMITMQLIAKGACDRRKEQ